MPRGNHRPADLGSGFAAPGMALSSRAGAKPEPRVAVRLVALRKPPEATKKSLDKVVAVAARRGSTLQPGTVGSGCAAPDIAAEWFALGEGRRVPRTHFAANCCTVRVVW